jgi:hypothetical protein
LKAILQKESQLQSVPRESSVVVVEGLGQHEIAVLISVAQQHPDPLETVSTFMIQQDMERAGFNNMAMTLGVRGLISKQMLEASVDQDYNNNAYTVYRVTDKGIGWLQENLDKLKLRVDPLPPQPQPMPAPDEIPF